MQHGFVCRRRAGSGYRRSKRLWCLGTSRWVWRNLGAWTMAIQIMDDTMTVEAGNRVVATALAGERAARRG